MTKHRRLAYIRLCGETSMAYYAVAAIVWLSGYKLGVELLDATWGGPVMALVVFAGVSSMEVFRLHRFLHKPSNDERRSR